MDIAEKIITSHRLILKRRKNLRTVWVKSQKQANLIAESLISVLADKDCALFLSGGKTPINLYKSLVLNKSFLPGAVGLIDERYDGKSNEKMIKDTGLIKSLDKKRIKFYPILKKDLSQSKTAFFYNQTVRSLLSNFKKSLGLLGLGSDGHIAGIISGFHVFNQENLISCANNSNAEFSKRITFTFSGLSELTNLIVLVLGKDKHEALNLIFKADNFNKVPGSFLINNKTLLITDQKF